MAKLRPEQVDNVKIYLCIFAPPVIWGLMFLANYLVIS